MLPNARAVGLNVSHALRRDRRLVDRVPWPATSWSYGAATVVLIAGVLLARLIYLIWLTPWQLLGDEAYYWQQARHLDWCYNEKGPLLAWMIAACCRVFGDTTWAVRLPMVVSFTAAAWGTGRLALAV